VARRKARPATRDETKQQTREALIDAATALFGELGLDAPSLDAICERAGFTRGAFYVHFRDRDDLVEAVMERVGAGFLDAILSTTEQDPDLTATAARFMNAVAAGEYPLMRDGGVRPHQLLDACARSKAIRERYVALANESVARLARVVAKSQARKSVRRDIDARATATTLLALIIGAQTMNDLGVPFDLAQTGATAMTLLSPPKRAAPSRRKGGAATSASRARDRARRR
jgi:AcrR family transcriptional regulator